MRLVPVLASLALVGACTTARRPDEAAVLACVSEAGVAGRFEVSTTLRASGYEVLLERGPDVSEAQAQVANQCIARLTAAPPAPSSAAAAATGAPAPLGAPVAVPPAGATPPTPARPVRAAPCHLEMTGGTGYACAP